MVDSLPKNLGNVSKPLIKKEVGGDENFRESWGELGLQRFTEAARGESARQVVFYLKVDYVFQVNIS